MRKILFIALVVLAGGVKGDAQESRTSPVSTMRADHWEQVNDALHLSGNVSIGVPGGAERCL